MDFKVQLYEKDQRSGTESKLDTQLIRIKSERISLYAELEKTLAQRFERLQRPNTATQIFWQDNEGDRINVKDQYGFELAIDNMSGPPYKLVVLFETTDANG